MEGSCLEECYKACAGVARRWIQVLTNKGYGLNDEELIDYIGESRMLSK